MAKRREVKKLKRKIEDRFLLISLLNDESLKAINSIFGTNYRKTTISKATVKDNKSFAWWKKMMEQKPKGGGYAG